MRYKFGNGDRARRRNSLNGGAVESPMEIMEEEENELDELNRIGMAMEVINTEKNAVRDLKTDGELFRARSVLEENALGIVEDLRNRTRRIEKCEGGIKRSSRIKDMKTAVNILDEEMEINETDEVLPARKHIDEKRGELVDKMFRTLGDDNRRNKN